MGFIDSIKRLFKKQPEPLLLEGGSIVMPEIKNQFLAASINNLQGQINNLDYSKGEIENLNHSKVEINTLNHINSRENQDFRSQIVVNPNTLYQSLEHSKQIEDYIEEFISQYLKRAEQNKDVAYRSFVRMFSGCREEEKGKNPQNEEKFENIVDKSKKYEVRYQAKNDRIIYKHISEPSNEINVKDKNVEKLYLNCERKDTAKLAYEVYKAIQKSGCPMQMKFIAEENGRIVKNPNWQRNDKIVVYAKNVEDRDKIAAEMLKIKQKKPELFSISKEIPLMPKLYGFIGSSKQVAVHDIFTTPYGREHCKTWNDKVSTLLEACFTAGVETVSKEQNIKGNSAKTANIYSNLDYENQQTIKQICRDLFVTGCKQNNIEIDYLGNKQRSNQINNVLANQRDGRQF